MHNTLPTPSWTAADWISHLQLEAHPEGGYYRRYFTSPVTMLTPRGERPSMTAVYYLLQGNDFSAWHRLSSSELWHFHAGSPCRIYQLAPTGCLSDQTLGPQTPLITQGAETSAHTVALGPQTPLITIPPNTWFAAELESPTREGFVLVSCTVSPGFDFADFELGDRESLVNLYPRHLDLICRLTR